MEKEKTIFDYLSQVLIIFAVTILILMATCVIFGEESKEISPMFAMGNKGLPISTMLQFLLSSVLVVILRIVFFTDYLIKKMPLFMRTILMYLSVIAVSIMLVIIFDWFPLKTGFGWIGFFCGFIVCATGSTLVIFIKDKKENDKMQMALEKLKQEKK